MKRRMTFDEFLRLLPKDGWTLGHYPGTGNEIIRADGRVCPWVYVSQLSGISADTSAWRGDRDKRQALFDAADDEPGHDPEIRRRLLEACGLKAKP